LKRHVARARACGQNDAPIQAVLVHDNETLLCRDDKRDLAAGTYREPVEERIVRSGEIHGAQYGRARNAREHTC
jgi:hypothetical protein